MVLFDHLWGGGVERTLLGPYRHDILECQPFFLFKFKGTLSDEEEETISG
jgi:hypothetical protein